MTISASGVYSVGPNSSPILVGTYSVQISQVTLNGIMYTSFTGVSMFTLTVVDPCATTTITPNAFSTLTAYNLGTP